LAADGGDQEAYWGEHSFDEQRYANLICMLYGSEPESYEAFADDAGLPDYDRDVCPDRYVQALNSWLAVLEPYADRGHGFSVTYARANTPEQRELADMLQASGLFREGAALVGDMAGLPVPLPIQFESCGEANAFYDPELRQVIMCYELVVHFQALYRDL
jgi:hypothetical protein